MLLYKVFILTTKKLSKGLSSKVFFLAIHPPQLPCSSIVPPPPNNIVKAEDAALKPSLWAYAMWFGNLSASPTLIPSQNKVGLP